MEHYKIVKKTFVGINDHGDLTERSKYKVYHKVLGLFWERMCTHYMFSDGSTTLSADPVGFDNEETAEKFIRTYHENRFKIGTYTIETVKNIDLE
jgi:hypothetical protein